jgi:hypothetical protein
MVGVERSGTTILRTMLDMHSRLAMTPESYFPVEWLRPHLRRVYEQAGADPRDSGVDRGVDSVDTELLLQELGKHEWFAKWGLPLDAVESAWRDRPPRTVPDALCGLYRAYGDAEGKALVGDKTPAFVWEIPLLASAFPTARFIHVVRDGRDVALAFKSLDHRPPDTLPAGVIYWRNHVRAGRRFGEAIPGRYTEIRYEDLLEQPQRELEKLCGFLDLGFEEQMLDHQSKAEATAATYVGPDVHANLRKPLSKGLRDWRRDISGSELAVLQRLGGSTLAAFGYETSPLPSGAAGIKATALAGAAEARFQAARYRNTLMRKLRQPAESRALRTSGDQRVHSA